MFTALFMLFVLLGGGGVLALFMALAAFFWLLDAFVKTIVYLLTRR